MSLNYQDIDVLHTELAAAFAHRNLKQADFDKLETLKKRKKGGWSMKKWNAASKGLAAANVAVDKLKTRLSELQARETEGGDAEGIDLEADTDNRREAGGDGQHGQTSRTVPAGEAPLVKDSGSAGGDSQHGKTLKARLSELQARETDGADAEGTDSNVDTDNHGVGQHGETSRAVLAEEAPLAKASGPQEALSRKAVNQNGGEQTSISESGPIGEASLAKDSGEQEAISRKAVNRIGAEEHAAVSERIEERAISENDSGALGKQTDQGSGEAHEPVHPASTLDKNMEFIHKTNETDTSGEPADPEMQTSGTSGKAHEDDSGDANCVTTAGIAGDSASREVRDEPTGELADKDMDAPSSAGMDQDNRDGSGSAPVEKKAQGTSDAAEKRKRKREEVTRGAENRMTSDNEEADKKKFKGEGRKDVQKTTKKEEGEQQEEDDEISKAVRENIRHPHRTLKTTVRTKIRSNQTIAPEAATTYRCIALDVLTTNRGNVLCPYHQEMDKKKAPQDSKFMITGVPLPRMAAETKKEAKTSEFRERLDSGFLHCGCQTDAALWDFYFWKTLTVTEKIDGKDVTEHVPCWTPRDRAFILKMFQEYTFLNIDDLYSRNMSPEWHREVMLTTQVERMLASINELREKRGMGAQVLQLVDEADKSDAEISDDDDGADR